MKYLLTGLIILLVAYVGNIEPPAVGGVKVIDGTEHIYKCFQRTYRNGYEFDNEYKIVLKNQISPESTLYLCEKKEAIFTNK